MKKLLVILCLFVGLTTLQAQSYMGLHTDNYAGVYSLYFNPAEIADSRYKVHVNLFSTNIMASNNYLGMESRALFEDSAFYDPNFNENYVVERLNGRRKSVYQDFDLGLPSFIVTFGKKKQRAVGFFSRVRQTVNVNGVDEVTARQAWNELELAEFYNQGIDNENFSLQAAVWSEFGLSYAQEILNEGKHFLKVGGSMKLTQGLASTYFYSNNAKVVFTSDSTMTVDDTDFSFGYSESFSNIPTTQEEVLDQNRYGLGWDFGAVYEYRPKHRDYKYMMDGDSNFVNPTKNQYLFKAGFSVTDLGFLNFERSRGYDGEFYADVDDIVLERFFEEAFQQFGTTGLQGFNDTLNGLFTLRQVERESYLVALPTRINMYFDYNIWKGFYANATISLAPGYIRNPEKTRALSEFSVTPRFEHRWFSAYIPISVNAHGNFRMGTALRMGPLVIGTNDITPLMGKETVYGANFYMAMNVPIFRSLKDRDKDHVSRKMDECRRKAGSWATKGCPDSDGDGIADSEDACPEVAGIAKFNGCPDTDEDGIQDSEDNCPKDAGIAKFKGCPDTDGDDIMDKQDDCPEEAGLVEYKGCPDTDGDKIIDSEDACPEVAGIPEFEGCPDSDGDGLQDSEDDCPDKAGLKEFNGCPDADKDGIMDKEDDCPETEGPKENKGCPWPDTDGDGVLDKDDDCVNTRGVPENNGCPEIKEEIKEIIKIAFDNLEFATGNARIRSKSFNGLNKLADVMKENESYNLRIAGHTDNVGDSDANMKLSRDRAEAVKEYLVKKGIDSGRFIVEAYGDTKPIADNNRSEGRKQNRRVELEIIFEK
jgi:outer membrane protein OmpA-like peptidoglycan-associated protein